MGVELVFRAALFPSTGLFPLTFEAPVHEKQASPFHGHPKNVHKWLRFQCVIDPSTSGTHLTPVVACVAYMSQVMLRTKN